MVVFQEYLDNLPLFRSQSTPIFQILLRILLDFVPIWLRFCPERACPDLNFPLLKTLVQTSFCIKVCFVGQGPYKTKTLSQFHNGMHGYLTEKL